MENSLHFDETPIGKNNLFEIPLEGSFENTDFS